MKQTLIYLLKAFLRTLLIAECLHYLLTADIFLDIGAQLALGRRLLTEHLLAQPCYECRNEHRKRSDYHYHKSNIEIQHYHKAEGTDYHHDTGKKLGYPLQQTVTDAVGIVNYPAEKVAVGGAVYIFQRNGIEFPADIPAQVAHGKICDIIRAEIHKPLENRRQYNDRSRKYKDRSRQIQHYIQHRKYQRKYYLPPVGRSIAEYAPERGRGHFFLFFSHHIRPPPL